VVARIERGEEVLLDIDVQGARQIRQAAENDPLIAAAAKFIIIAPPDLETLKSRLCGRNSETPEQLKLRLDAAISELSNFRLYDYLVVNGDLDTAAAELTAIFRAIRLHTSNITGDLF
jgi:guanylate kinase